MKAQIVYYKTVSHPYSESNGRLQFNNKYVKIFDLRVFNNHSWDENGAL